MNGEAIHATRKSRMVRGAMIGTKRNPKMNAIVISETFIQPPSFSLLAIQANVTGSQKTARIGKAIKKQRFVIMKAKMRQSREEGRSSIMPMPQLFGFIGLK